MQKEKTFISLVFDIADALKNTGRLHPFRCAVALEQLADFSQCFETPFEDLSIDDLTTEDTSDRPKFWRMMSKGATFLVYSEDLARAYKVEGTIATDNAYLLELQATYLLYAWNMIEMFQSLYKDGKPIL